MRPTNRADSTVQKLPHVYRYHRSHAAGFRGDEPYELPDCWTATGPSSVWARTARLCRLRDLDPVRYVQWAVSTDRVLLGSFPEPSELPDMGCMRAFAASLPGTRAWLGIQYQAAVDGIAVSYLAARAEGESKALARLAAVRDRYSGTEGIAAYAYLARHPTPRLARAAAAMRPQALLAYYLHAAEYAALIPGDSLPPGFAAAAADFYDEVIGWTQTAQEGRR